MAEMMKGKFGFHRGGGKHEPVPAAAYVQIYVKFECPKSGSAAISLDLAYRHIGSIAVWCAADLAPVCASLAAARGE